MPRLQHRQRRISDGVASRLRQCRARRGADEIPERQRDQLGRRDRGNELGPFGDVGHQRHRRRRDETEHESEITDCQDHHERQGVQQAQRDEHQRADEEPDPDRERPAPPVAERPGKGAEQRGRRRGEEERCAYFEP